MARHAVISASITASRIAELPEPAQAWSLKDTRRKPRERNSERGVAHARPALRAGRNPPAPVRAGTGRGRQSRGGRVGYSRVGDGRLGDGIEAKATQEKKRGAKRSQGIEPQVPGVHAMRLRVVSMLRDGEVAVRGAGGPSQRVPGVMAARSQVAGRRLHKAGLSRCEPEVDVGNTTDEADPAMGQRVPTPSATPRHTLIRGKRPADEDWQSLHEAHCAGTMMRVT
ncbi:hypothetical protein B2J93_6266 [Marssonina coronariae]|uniref:Uncharacterized protein n=1 Tax=Diplocarpon coronariae TaxID=2795749 RepID=A0A218ZDY2_9HELO|nr:hypothetical protein B2J93_6266 [Marssonina coronariae]